VARSIQQCRVLDCDGGEVCRLRHYACGESSTGKCAEQHIRIGVTLESGRRPCKRWLEFWCMETIIIF
jgi:hypothetical protein